MWACDVTVTCEEWLAKWSISECPLASQKATPERKKLLWNRKAFVLPNNVLFWWNTCITGADCTGQL